MKKDAALFNLDRFGVFTLYPGEPEFLYGSSSTVKPGTVIVEIGSCLGRGSHILCAGAEEANARVISVSLFLTEDDKVTFSLNNARWLKTGVLTSIVGDSHIEVPMLVGSFPVSMVFVDGDHSYGSAKDDITNALSMLSNGGLLAVHDYTDKALPGVKKACDEILGHIENVGVCGTIFNGTKL